MVPARSGRRFRRPILPLILAVALAAQASGAVFAVRESVPEEVGPTAAPGAPTAAVAERVSQPAGVEPIVDWSRRPESATARASGARVAAVRATPAAVAVAESIAPKAPSGAPSSYRGTNRVWIPSLGLNRSVSFFACTRNTALDHVVYRWGCAGSNNVYLMGHASSVLKPLHDAYVNGRLRKGMEVIYADGNGRVTRYAVSFWKVVAPDGDVAWAYAAQSRPSMTLQTCVGANNAYRLVVRLAKVG